MKITVLGAGSFGTAMADHASKMGHEVMLWCRRDAQAKHINLMRKNPDYLKDVELSGGIVATSDLRESLIFSNNVILAVPTQSLRSVLEEAASFFPGGVGLRLLSLAKGIEIRTGCFLHQIARELLPCAVYSVLSGPSHAEEVALGMPSALVAASADNKPALMWQELLNNDRLRVYTSNDVLGVEIGGAMKNVIAIAVGVARAIRFGDNSIAALVTRGLAEMMRYGAFEGANPLTMAGLTGIGDLMVTCYSMHSRNFRFGMAVGSGKSMEEAAGEIGQVVEGMHTARALVTRARRESIELPLSEGVYRVLYEDVPLKRVLTELLFRDPRPEMDG